MEELKARIIDAMNKINQNWVTALKKAYEKNTKVSSTEMMGLYSEIMKEVELRFREARERGLKNGKKFWR